MEYAAGGELFARICSAGRFSEDEVILLSPIPCIIPVFDENEMLYLSSLYLYQSTTGSFLLPTANIWSQLLSCHGKFEIHRRLVTIVMFFLVNL